MQTLHCSTTADGVVRYFVAHAVIIKLCYQGSVLSTLSECVKNVHIQPNVKKSFLKDIWRHWWLVSNYDLVYGRIQITINPRLLGWSLAGCTFSGAFIIIMWAGMSPRCLGQFWNCSKVAEFCHVDFCLLEKHCL